MKRCFIFAAGTFFGLRERPAEGDLIIAADAGYRNCRAAGLTPHLLLGDFDSMDLPQTNADVVRLPVEKDDTDTMAAVKVALQRGCEAIYIYGGTGGKRLDHTLCNLHTLLHIRRHGARGYLYDNDFCWTVMENETLYLTREVDWGIVSVFPLGERAEGIDEVGLQYPLDHAVLTAEDPIGVSNHFVSPQAHITVRSGVLAVGWELPALHD